MTKTIPEVYTERICDVLRVHNGAEETMISPALAPTYDSIQTAMYRARAKHRPPLPRTRDALLLPDRLRMTLAGDDFLLIDDGSADRILIFAIHEFLRIACQCNCIFMDGTFDTVPEIFCQLYPLHGFF